MGFLYYLSSIPGDAMSVPIGLPDYVLHAGGYAVLCTLVYVTLRRGWGMPLKISMILSWMISVSYGVLDEYHQSFVPLRTPDFRDVLADGVGALLALVVIYILRSLYSGRVKNA